MGTIMNTFAQRSPEWFAARGGKITGTDAVDLMFEKSETQAFRNLINRCRAERMFNTPQALIDNKVHEFVNGERLKFDPTPVAYGRMMEHEAKLHIEEQLDVIIDEVGFVQYSETAGCSPDGLILGQNTGIEIKCPVNIANHYQTVGMFDLKKYNKDYYYQCLMGMVCTGFDMWYFFSYMPWVEPKLTHTALLRAEHEKEIQLLTERLEYAHNLIIK